MMRLATLRVETFERDRGLMSLSVEEPSRVSAPIYAAVARVLWDGRIEELHVVDPVPYRGVRMIRPYHECVREKLETVTFPRPPKDPFWIAWTMSYSAPLR